MTSRVLEYAAPTKFKFEWRYLRLSAGHSLFDLCWLGYYEIALHPFAWCFRWIWTHINFSLHDVVAAHLDAEAKINIASAAIYLLNVIYIATMIIWRRGGFKSFIVYSSLASTPLLLLFAIDFFYPSLGWA